MTRVEAAMRSTTEITKGTLTKVNSLPYSGF